MGEGGVGGDSTAARALGSSVCVEFSEPVAAEWKEVASELPLVTEAASEAESRAGVPPTELSLSNTDTGIVVCARRLCCRSQACCTLCSS